MAKRHESLVDALLVLPWWVSWIFAAVSFVMLKFVAPLHFTSHHTAGIGTAAENNAHWAAFFFLLISSLSFSRAFFIKRKFSSLAGIDHVRHLSWRQFESIVGEAFRRRGYRVVENAVDGPDGGVDLVLRKDSAKIYVQCKQWKQTKVGVKPVRELYGVMAAAGADGGFFVASGEYTQEAREFARKCTIELIDGPTLAEMIAQVSEPQAFMDPTSRRRTKLHIESPIESPISESTCPICGGAMVRRTAKRGAHVGREFWGCGSYPRCRGTRPI